MKNIIEQTLFFWNVLMLDARDNIPETRREKVRKKLKSTGSILLIANSVILTFIMSPIFYKNDSSDILGNQKVLWDVGMWLSMITMACRHFTLFKNVTKVKELTSGPLAGNYSKIQIQKYNLTKRLRTTDRYLKILRTYLCCSQLLQILQTLIVLVTYGRHFSLSMDFPFDTTKLEVFVLALLWLQGSSIVFVTATIVTDSLLCYLVTTTTIELDIWRIDFKDLKGLSETEKVKRLPVLIDRYNSIFGTVKDVEGIFSPYFLVSLVLNSLCICVNLFQVASLADLLKNGLNLLMCILMLLLIGMICFYGQMLLDASEKIHMEVFDCGWEGFEDVRLKKMIQFMLMRSQKPQKLTFMGFSDINVEQFRGVRIDY
jgi:7tm Odorant receptor